MKPWKIALLGVFVCWIAPVEVCVANVRISGFSDMHLDSWSGTGPMTGSNNLCVYNSAGTGYSITASGSGSAGAFSVQKGGDNLTYAVTFKGSALIAGTPASFTGANQVSNNCGGASNAILEISISESALSAAAPGSYQGTLTVIVVPN